MDAYSLLCVPMAGERLSCSRWHPVFEVAWGQLVHLDYLREVLLSFKWPQAAWTWQTFRFTVNIGHRIHCLLTADSSVTCSELLISSHIGCIWRKLSFTIFLYLHICNYIAYICSPKGINWVDVMIHNHHTLLVHHDTFISEANRGRGKYYFYTLFWQIDAM